jgi:hypothetical protein
MVPVEYRGELVALVSARRVHIVAPWLLARPSGDPDLRFVAFMCAYAAQVMTGAIREPFSSELAETWARRALLDNHVVAELDALDDADAARSLNVPVEQIRSARQVAATSNRLKRERTCVR